MLLYDLFIFPNEKVKNKARDGFLKKAVFINDILGRKATIEEIKIAFKEGFKKGLDIELSPFEPNDQMLIEVEDLMKSKYANDDYTFQR